MTYQLGIADGRFVQNVLPIEVKRLFDVRLWSSNVPLCHPGVSLSRHRPHPRDLAEHQPVSASSAPPTAPRLKPSGVFLTGLAPCDPPPLRQGDGHLLEVRPDRRASQSVRLRGLLHDGLLSAVPVVTPAPARRIYIH